MSEGVAHHFADAEQQEQAARLGVLVFLASEGLLFAGLFALYGGYRAHYADAFAAGVREDLRWLGTLNTGVLLVSSGIAAVALAKLELGAELLASRLLKLTALLGVCFLGLKGYEYAVHFHDGIFPGSFGHYFVDHRQPGLAIFFSLYYLMTGLHALHVIVGIVWIAIASRMARRGRSRLAHVELAAMYWHFVDLIWVFLWPLFYLLGGGVP